MARLTRSGTLHDHPPGAFTCHFAPRGPGSSGPVTAHLLIIISFYHFVREVEPRSVGHDPEWAKSCLTYQLVGRRVLKGAHAYFARVMEHQ